MGHADPHLIAEPARPDLQRLNAALIPMQHLLAGCGLDRHRQLFAILPITGWGDIGAVRNWSGLPVRYADVPYPLIAMGSPV